jgi:hypothetical protein
LPYIFRRLKENKFHWQNLIKDVIEKKCTRDEGKAEELREGIKGKVWAAMIVDRS